MVPRHTADLADPMARTLVDGLADRDDCPAAILIVALGFDAP